ncbi:MAG: hypothetical protein NG747_16230 [Candidatus Brocadia sp.]|nr:hypothetical protein [Candidatus Brocadia sp.]
MRSAIGDLLGEDYSLAQKDKAYRCLDLLLEYRDELFAYLKEKWGKLFGAKYDVRSVPCVGADSDVCGRVCANFAIERRSRAMICSCILAR